MHRIIAKAREVVHANLDDEMPPVAGPSSRQQGKQASRAVTSHSGKGTLFI